MKESTDKNAVKLTAILEAAAHAWENNLTMFGDLSTFPSPSMLRKAKDEILLLEKQRDEMLEVLNYCRTAFPQERWADDAKKMIDTAIVKVEGGTA